MCKFFINFFKSFWWVHFCLMSRSNQNFGDAIAVQDLKGNHLWNFVWCSPPRTKILAPPLLSPPNIRVQETPCSCALCFADARGRREKRTWQDSTAVTSQTTIWIFRLRWALSWRWAPRAARSLKCIFMNCSLFLKDSLVSVMCRDLLVQDCR